MNREDGKYELSIHVFGVNMQEDEARNHMRFQKE